MTIPDIKIMMLKGEKGDKPTSEELQKQIASVVLEKKDELIDKDFVKAEVTDWLVANVDKIDNVQVNQYNADEITTAEIDALLKEGE